ncbi:MAG: HAMP domain-containing sensor histidine kinase [Trueperaceae bacterium]
MKRRFLTSRGATRVAFGVIIAFVTAQMAWWIYFQAQFVEQVSQATVTGLEREAITLNALLDQGAEAEVQNLLAEQPRLRLDQATGTVLLNEQALEEYMAEHRSVVRMFAFEGPFFVLVVMLGLFIIARNLRLERELKRRQSNFLDAIGHEYKTPLSTLRLLIETIQLRELKAEKLQEYLGRMSAEVDRLDHTGQQVLATARLEADAPPVTRQRYDLGSLVVEILAQARPVLEARGAQLELEPAIVPTVVNVSTEEVTLMLDNLIDNAIKYSPGAAKRVKVKVAREGKWASLSVEDQGTGIPENERENVLDRFYRVGSELTRTSPGLGLGLYLVRRAVEALGGRVGIEDGAGGGTLITILLPLLDASEYVAAPATAGAMD